MFEKIEEKIKAGFEIERDEALRFLRLEEVETVKLMALANSVRDFFKGRKITLCSIVNAKSGLCNEDCKFCAQSKHHSTNAPVYGLKSEEEILNAQREALSFGATEFSIVTSGTSLRTQKEFEDIKKTISSMKSSDMAHRCASLGIMPYEKLVELKNAGLTNYHHNLETSREFFPKICTTHGYEEDVETVKNAKKAGFKVCSGGIFGMGEEDEDVVSLAFTLKEFDVDSIPLNFLIPIKGTKLESAKGIPPMKILRIISVFRLVNPKKDIVVCGGREANLKDMQSLVFFAGANGILIGNYLTTKGNPPEKDIAMIKDMGLEPDIDKR